MPLSINLRKLLHQRKWEHCTPAPIANVTGETFVAVTDLGANILDVPINRVFAIGGVSSIWEYLGSEDGWIQLPNSGLAGTFGAGVCAEFHPYGPSGTATGGTTTTIVTNLTIPRDLRGFRVRITAGPAAGADVVIASNTIGANSVITVSAPFSTAITAASVYQLMTGRLFVFVPSATAPVMSFYDPALNTWTGRAVTGLPASFTGNGQLLSTPGIAKAFATGTATAGAATTITNTPKTWTVNQWSNFAQVRITAGTGAGQARRIVSNTANTLTVAAAWTVTPDATSAYVIEGDDDSLYLIGNSAVPLYRFSLAGNTWTTVTAATARAAAPGAAMTADCVSDAGDAAWSDESNHLNGRYIYAFRGGGTNALDRFDLALGNWLALAYGNQNVTFTTGTCSVVDRNRIFIAKEATGRIFRFDVVRNVLQPLTTALYPQGAVTDGDKLFVLRYKDGATELPILHFRRHSGVELLRAIEV